MTKTIRLLAAVLCLFLMGGLIAERQGQGIRDGYAARELHERRAELEAEITWVESKLAAARRLEALLERARRLGIDPGRRGGAEMRAPAPGTGAGE